MSEHEQAIDILLECVTGKREILPLLFEVAKQYPNALICAAHRSTAPSLLAAPSWIRDAHLHLEAGNKVTCIKMLRAEKNLGLKEAIDLINKYSMGSGLDAFRDIVDPVPF